VTEDFLHRVILNYRGVIRKIGANKSSVTPHGGATAPLLKEPFLRQHKILPSQKDKRSFFDKLTGLVFDQARIFISM
jgi:hypothetical protein